MEQNMIDKMKSGIETVLGMKDFGEMVATFWNNTEKQKYFSRAYKEVMILYKNKYGIDLIYSTNAPMEDEEGKEWNIYIERMKKKLKENENLIDLLEKIKECWRTSEKDNEEQLEFLTKTFLEKIIQYGCVDGKEVIIREIFRKQGEIKDIQVQLLKNQQQGRVNNETILKITIDTNQKVTELLENQTSDPQDQEKDKLKRMANEIAKKRQEYAARYEEELPPMDDNSISVNLKQLYVEPDCLLVYPYKNKNKYSLFSYLKEFLRSNTRLLFMEGDAGIGKTSFVSKIAYHYEHFEKSKLGDNFFEYRRLICVRLRDMLEKNQILNVDNPWEDIFRYLNIKKDEQKDEENQLSLLILDGFDELCMVESIQNEKKTQYFKNLLKNLKFGRIRWKVIVTSRPNYIHWEELEDFDSYIKVIQLQHFSIEKRSKWIEKAKIAGLSISEEVEKGVTTIDREELEAIIGIPWTLYLVTKKEIVITSDANLWHIYYLIFKRENIERNFEMNAMHKTEPLKEYLYQITGEIALWMYQNQRFDINVDKINQLIEEMEIPNEAKKNKQNETTISDGGEQRIYRLLKDTYALHIYYRKSDDKGGLAFYHNYIQDFFLCEQIFLELDRAYMGLEKCSNKVDCLIACYKKLFLLGLLNENTIKFIQARIQYESKLIHTKVSKWIEIEKKNKIFVQTFEDMILYGFGQSTQMRENKKTILKVMENIFSNCWKIYDYLYGLQDKESCFFSHILEKNKDELGIPIKTIVEIVCKNVRFSKIRLVNTDLHGINLSQVSLINADLRKSDLSQANLSRSDLSQANLNGSNLSQANLQNTNLMKADLRKIQLEEADLEGINLNEANLSEMNLNGINLRGVNLNGANLQGTYLNESDLQDARLIETNLKKASLIGANLSGANLSGADLSYTNLRGIRMTGTDLSRANLRGANLNFAHLREVNLRETNLRGANLSYANLSEIDLSEVDLSESNLNGANLDRISLGRKDLRAFDLTKIRIIAADLRETNLSGMNLRGLNLNFIDRKQYLFSVYTNLSGANLNETNLSGADLSFTVLNKANLRRADLSYASLNKIDLSEADLSEANLIATDMRGASLSEANLNGADLRRVNLKDVNLNKAKLRGADLRFSSLEGTSLRGADLSESNLKEASLKEVDLSETDLSRVDFRGVNIKKVNLRKAKLMRANLSGVDLSGINLEGVNLIRVDLSEANLNGVDLSGMNLRGANLNGIDLKEVNLRGVNLSGANLVEVDLRGVDLIEVDLRGVNLVGANLERANLKKINLEGANLERANLKKINLKEANLEGSNLEGANLKGANLGGANLKAANLKRNYLWKTNLEGANLEGANLEKADLNKINLEKANLKGANLEWARLSEVNLEGTNLEEADLKGVNLRRADLKKTILRNANLTGTDLEWARLSEVNLEGTNLEEADLKGVNLRRADLRKTILRNVNLTGADLDGGNLEAANLEGAKLRGANLKGTNLKRANLKGVQLIQFDLDNPDIIKMLSEANLEEADWSGVTDEQKEKLLSAK